MTVQKRQGEDDLQPGRDDERPPEEAKRLLEQRSQLHVLLAENPNYFGNLGDSGLEPKFEIINDSYFEQVTCLALNPDVDVLEATGAIGALATSATVTRLRKSWPSTREPSSSCPME